MTCRIFSLDGACTWNRRGERRPPICHPARSILGLELVQEAIDHLHDLTNALRAPIIEEDELPATLRRYIDRLPLAQGQNVVFETDPDVGTIAPDVAIACLRIAQEALGNAVKHSGAKNLQVNLRRVDHDVTVFICDDGIGFDEPLARSRALDSGSVGLLTMRERASLAGGSLMIDSSPGHGTCISAVFAADREARPSEGAAAH